MNDSIARYWFALLHSKQLPRRVAKEVLYRWCVEDGRPVSALDDAGIEQLRERSVITAEQAAAVWQALAGASSSVPMLERMVQEGIDIILRTDVAYPDALAERLGEQWLPYYFFARGDPTLLSEPALSILGGADLTPEAEALAQGLAHALVEEGHHLVGGYDQGADRVALEAARTVGGQAIIVLPLGMDHFQTPARSMEEDLAQGRVLLLSPYEPDAEYSPALADARRVIIAAMAEALFLVAPDRGPDAWLALPQFLLDHGRFFVWTGTDAEVARAWVEKGAIPFSDLAEARQHVRTLFGVAAEGEEPDIDAVEDVEPISFADAESAIELLGRSGNVPEVLARRLRDVEWPNDMDYLVQHDDLLADERAESDDE